MKTGDKIRIKINNRTHHGVIINSFNKVCTVNVDGKIMILDKDFLKK